MNKKLKNPDLTRFGFYLYPKVYKGSMGFDKAHGLLFLDSTGRIEDALAKEIGLVKLLNSSTAVLYAINPVGGKYPNASELLKALSLGSVAKQRLITKEELRREFLDQCLQCNIVIDLLDKAVRIGVNKDGYVVYESKSGRYIVDEKGETHRDLESEELLYAVDADGEMINDKVEYCLESLFKFHLNVVDDDIDFIDANDFNSFVQTVVRRPPPILPKMGDFTPISFYGDSESVSIGAKTALIIDVLEKLEARLMLDFDFNDDEAFEKFFHHIYNRNLPATSHGFKQNLPAPLLIMLLRLLNFNLIDTPHIYVPAVGNTALLAGLVKLNERGAKITACERFADKQSLFNDFLEDALVTDVVVHPHASIENFDGSIGYLTLGDEASAVLIPDSDSHTYKKSLVQMLDLLSRRNAGGRSIFISPVDSEGSLGRLDEDSTLFIRHLYQNYQNVLIFDCNRVLSMPSRNICEYRIYVIGELIEDYSLMNSEDLAELIINPKIQTVDTPEDFYLICAKYASEIDAVEISSIDLMDNLMDIMDDDDDVPSVSKEESAIDSAEFAGTPTSKATPITTDDTDDVEKATDVSSIKEEVESKTNDDKNVSASTDDDNGSGDDADDKSGNSDSTGDTSSSGDASGGGRGKKLTDKLVPASTVVNGESPDTTTKPVADRDNDDASNSLDNVDDDSDDNNIIIISSGADTDDDSVITDDIDPDAEEFVDNEEPDDDEHDFDDPDAISDQIENRIASSGMSR